MNPFFRYLCLGLSLIAWTAKAAVPQILNHQGRIAVGGVSFEGSGGFKFALVDAAGTTSYWSNDGTSVAGSQPSAAVALNVTKGLYSVLLGDPGVPNMSALPPAVFDNADVRLRVWFNDGVNGFEPISPDHRLAAAPWAMVAGTAELAAAVPDGAISGAMISPGAVGTDQLASDLTLAGITTGTFSGDGSALAGVTSVPAPGTISTPVTIALNPWETAFQALANTSYLTDGSNPVTVTLPGSANVGDVVTVTGAGTGGWTILGYNPPSVLWAAHENIRHWWAVASSADGTKLVAVAAEFGDPIFISSDSGETWTPQVVPGFSGIWVDVASSADGTKLVTADYNGFIHTSADSGATWTPRETARTWLAVASSADGQKLVAIDGYGIGNGGRIYTSADAGVTWTPRESERRWRCVASSADGAMLVAADDSGFIYTSADSGVTWTPRDSGRGWRSIASSADGSRLVAVAYRADRIYTSSDAGASWTPRETVQLWTSVACSADGSRLVAVGEGSNFGETGVFGGWVYTSADFGETWTAGDVQRLWVDVASSADGLRMAGVADTDGPRTDSGTPPQGGRIYTSPPPGFSYVEIAAGGQGSTATVQYLGNAVWRTIVPAGSAATGAPGALIRPQAIGGGAGKASVNTSYVATGTTVTTLELPGTGMAGDVVQVTGAGTGGWQVTKFVPDYSAWTPQDIDRGWNSLSSSADGTRLVASDYAFTIDTSADGGVTWSEHEFGRPWICTASSADGTKLVAAGSPDFIWTSADSGETWVARDGPSSWSALASSADGTKLVATEAGGMIYTSADSGTTWTPRESDRDWYGVASSADGTRLVAVDGNGTGDGGRVYLSGDSGATWEPRESERYWYAVASSAEGTKLVAIDGYGVGDGGRIYTSTDSGDTWTPRDSDRFWISVASSADGGTLLASESNGKLFVSTDSGATWTPQEDDRNWGPVASSADGTRLFAAEVWGKIYTSGGSVVVVASGAQGSTATFQMLPDGQWAPVAASIPDTTVTGSLLTGLVSAPGTITAADSILTAIGKLSANSAASSPTLLADIVAAPLKPVVAWGDNNDGQTAVPALANVTAIAAGSTRSLALLADGTVTAWGAGAAVPPGLAGVSDIAAGTSHFLARKSDGSVTAWGDDSFGQSADQGFTTAIKVAAGEKHSIALLADGTVAAWGDDSFHQTAVPGGLAGVIGIAAGYDHSLALKSDGTVEAWGRDDAGQIAVPVGLGNVVAVAAGAFHSLALLGDGTVVAWGWNGGGQADVPVDLSGVTAIAGGYAFSVALKSDGTLVTWGDNTDGQTTVPAQATHVAAIAAGASHVVALRQNLIPAQVARLDQDNVFTGKLGIQRIPATNVLEVEGQASKTTAGNWAANSDRRIKTGIEPLSHALQTLDRVRLVDFRYTGDYLAAHPSIEDKRYLNVIAQEFAEVFPDHVKGSGERLPDGSEILQVDTYPLTIYSAAAVQELHRENQALKRQLADQELRLRKLENALNR